MVVASSRVTADHTAPRLGPRWVQRTEHPGRVLEEASQGEQQAITITVDQEQSPKFAYQPTAKYKRSIN